MSQIITEVTPLSERDFFYLVDRTKDSFSFPIHRHEEFELNYIEHCSGASRVVGDSICELGEYDLCLIGHGIEHGWLQHNCTSRNIREITIQFSSRLFGEEMLIKNQFASIRTLLEQSAKGISFGMSCLMKAYHHLDLLLHSGSDFKALLFFIDLLYELSIDTERKILSSHSFSDMTPSSDSRRIQKVQNHIYLHYNEKIRLEDLAEIARMSPTSFSRFFKLRTGRSLQDYITDVRLGHATRALMDSTASIAEICFDCGFNNISNFNRIFKKHKGCTPKEFREFYRRNKVII